MGDTITLFYPDKTKWGEVEASMLRSWPRHKPTIVLAPLPVMEVELAPLDEGIYRNPAAMWLRAQSVRPGEWVVVVYRDTLDPEVEYHGVCRHGRRERDKGRYQQKGS